MTAHDLTLLIDRWLRAVRADDECFPATAEIVAGALFDDLYGLLGARPDERHPELTIAYQANRGLWLAEMPYPPAPRWLTECKANTNP